MKMEYDNFDLDNICSTLRYMYDTKIDDKCLQ